jgi:glycosyltransferase involved in cell wall biosynthesis
MFCSSIIPTVNRPTLSRAVRSVLNQEFDEEEFEVIVVNDSGEALPDSEWRRSRQVRVVDTGRRERSVARNTGAAIARGEYLHFLDDDDVLLPRAMQAFRRAASETDAVWLYGSWQTVDNSGKMVDEFRPALDGNIFALLVAGEGLPLQASLLRAECFFETGGFDCAPSVIGVEDRDLGRRLALRGAIAHVPEVVAQVRIGLEGSTTQWTALAERDRWGREKALNCQSALRRLRCSADSGYWRGRVSRAYAASAVWNLKRLDAFTASSRLAASLFLAAPFVFSAAFWRGLNTRIR